MSPDLKLVRENTSQGRFCKKKQASPRPGWNSDGPNGFDGRNELFRKNTTNFKKSFSKSIKNSLHNRFRKLDTSHFGVSVPVPLKKLQIHQKPSKVIKFTIEFPVQKIQVLKKHHFFWNVRCPTSMVDYETNFL